MHRAQSTAPRLCATFGAALLALGWAPAGALAAPGWEVVEQTDGITVWTREAPDRDLPLLRGAVILEASPHDVLAVITDVERSDEWLRDCAEARVLSRRGEHDYVAYNRTSVPWPLSDRDAVVRTRAAPMKAGEILVRFQAVEHPAAPIDDDLVRMERIRGLWRLTARPNGRTRVEYVVDVDPGGNFPAWLSRSASLDFPRDTLHRLRKQVRRTRANGRYAARIQRWLKTPAVAQAD